MEDEVGGEIITTETGYPLGFDPQLALPRILLNIGGPGGFWETQYTCSEVLNLLLTVCKCKGIRNTSARC